MRIIAIDPGPEQSAMVVYDSNVMTIWDYQIFPNTKARDVLDGIPEIVLPIHFVIEKVQSYGMPVGDSVFDTCIWIGRFIETLYRREGIGLIRFVHRSQVKLELCHNTFARDSNVRQALIDLFGGSRQKAIGTKAKPGPLYGIKRDLWAALAIAVAYAQTDGKIGMPVE